MEDLTTIYSLILLFLIFLSSILSCCETSITASSRAKIHRLAEEGDKRARKLMPLLISREKVIGVILTGNNAVNILASGVAASMLIKIFGEAGVIYATIMMTLIILVFAEILPKTIAFKSPEQVALFLAPVIYILVKILMPFTNFAHRVIDFFISPFFKSSTKKIKALEIAEIRDAIDLKTKEGYLIKYDKDLIDGVLDLADTEIVEIMVHRKDIRSIDANLPLNEIISQALDIGHTRIPLWKDNQENVVAILNVRKMLKFLHLNNGKYEKFKLEDVSNKPWFVPASNTLRSQLFAFRRARRRMAFIIDEYGSILGLVTLEDILEEIVGDIEDQDDKERFDIIKTKSGFYKITAKTLIRDLNKKLELDLEEDEHAYNLAAFIINRLGRIPEERERFILDECKFEVLKKKGQDLILLKVKKI